MSTAQHMLPSPVADDTGYCCSSPSLVDEPCNCHSEAQSMIECMLETYPTSPACYCMYMQVHSIHGVCSVQLLTRHLSPTHPQNVIFRLTWLVAG